MNLNKVSKGILGISIKMVVYILVIVVVYKLAVFGYTTGEKIFTDEGYKEEPGKNISVTITKSMSAMEVGELLEDKGIIEDKYIFYIQQLLYEADFKEGKYKLNTSSAPEDIINTLSSEPVEGE